MMSLSCFVCTKGLHHVVESAINSDSGNFHSVYQTQQFHKSCQQDWWFIVSLDGQDMHHLQRILNYLTFFEV